MRDLSQNRQKEQTPLEVAVLKILAEPDKAKTLAWAILHPEFHQKPVPVREFITSPNYLNVPDTWEQILVKLDKLFEGSSETGRLSPYREFVFDAGIGSGKSFIVSLCFAYAVYWLLCLKDPQKYFGLETGSPICLTNASVTGSQAKRVVFGNIKTRIDNSPWFQQYALPDPSIRSELRFPKSIIIFPGSSSQTAPLGYNVFLANIDEASFFIETDLTDAASVIHDALSRRITSRFGTKGLLAITSSPQYVDDFTEKKFDESKTDTNILGFKCPTWEMRPDDIEAIKNGDYFEITPPGASHKVKIPNKYAKDFKKDPRKAWRDFGAVASMALEPYFEEWESQRIFELCNASPFPQPVIDGQINPELKPIPGVEYRIHIDLGIVRDACGLAMAYSLDGKKVHVPLIIRIACEKRAMQLANKGGQPIDMIIGSEQVDIDSVLKIVYDLAGRGFFIGMVTFDNFQSLHSRQTLINHGFKAELLSVDKDTEAYDSIKTLVRSNNLEICPHVFFPKECQRLELIKGKKIDHPPNGSKDLADAVAGACKSVLQRNDEEVESEEIIWDESVRVDISEEI